ncbi:MAG: hypothetical protein ABI551_04275 [Polyangiaceae bacterium]
MKKLALTLFVLSLALVCTLAACAGYRSPPVVTIAGLDQGKLADSAQPLVLLFSKPIDPETLSVKVIRFDPDPNGKLPDELGDPTVDLAPLYTYDSVNGDVGGTGVLDPNGTSFTITPDARFPVGPKLAVLVEPGLTNAAHDDTGTTGVRKRLLFSYAFNCAGTGTQVLTSGDYFFLLDVEQPVGTQIKVFAKLDVDGTTGKFTGQFTFAQRLTDPNRCSPGCTDGKVCKTLPGPPTCVVPSERAGTPTEWPDFFPNSTPPVGFSFTVNGCAEDQPDGTATFASEPANMIVQQPSVQINGLTLVASFTKDGSGGLSASGSVAGDDVLLGGASLGPGHGTTVAQSLPEGSGLDIPSPPPLVEADH